MLIALAFMPVLVLHASSLWSRPHYQFFPLLIPGAVALVMQSCRRLGSLQPGGSRQAFWIAALGWVLFTLSVVFLSTTLSAVSALVTLHAAIFAIGGWPLVRATLPAYAFLWLAVPPPRHLDAELVSRLQALVSRCSSAVLDAAHVFHVMEGNVVDVGGQRLLVDQACSGIYSLFTLLLGTSFFALLVRASFLRTAFLLTAAVAWVLLGNIARIVSIVLLSTRWGIDATTGWKHETIGLVIFAAMLVMLASSDRLYGFAVSVFRWMWMSTFGRVELIRQGQGEFNETLATAARGPGKSKGGQAPSASSATAADPREAEYAADYLPPTELPPPRATWLGSPFAAAAFGLMLIPQMLMPGVNWKEVLLANDFYLKAFDRMTADTLPKVSGKFDRLDFRKTHREMDDSWGENSRTWYYRHDKSAGYAALSLDYQFVDWHDLTLCYTGQGWIMEGSRVGALGRSGTRDARSLVEADFINLEGRHGHLIYGLFDRRGRVVTPPEARGFVQALIARLRSWLVRSSQGSEAADGLNYQYQLFVESDQPPSSEARDEALVFFEETKALAYEKAFATAAETEGGPK